jgi:lipopolysaccharide transport system permease protein
MVLLALVTALGAGLLISALNVKYRDFRYIVSFLTQFWLFATPVVYPATMIPEKWRLLIGINPMAGAIEGFRWALIGTDVNPWPLVITSGIAAVVLLVIGYSYFNRTEEFFADLI